MRPRRCSVSRERTLPPPPGVDTREPGRNLLNRLPRPVRSLRMAAGSGGGEGCAVATALNNQERLLVQLKVLGIFASLYLFIAAIGAMAHAFNLFGREFAEAVLETTENPIFGLFVGILATALVQSSSTSTSIIVGMVAGGARSEEHTSVLQSRENLVCRLLLEKKNNI